MPVDTAAMVLSVVLVAGTTGLSKAESPDTELLEFLVHFESSDGQWLDPLTLDDEPAAPREPRDEEKHP